MASVPTPSAFATSDQRSQIDDLLGQLERLHLTNLRRARQLGRQALALAEALGEPEPLARALLWQGILRCHGGGYARAFGPLQRALAQASAAGDTRTGARVRNCLGIACTELGRYAEALEHHHENLRLVQERGDLAGRLRALVNIGELRSKLGDPQQGLAHQREALQIARQLRSPVDGLFASINVMADLARLGRHTQAIRRAEGNLTLARQLNFTNEQAVILICLAKSLLALGRPSEALGRAQAGLEVIARAPQSDLECEARTQLGRALARLGNPVGARAQLQQAVALADQHGYRRLSVDAHLELAELLRQADPAAAYPHLAHARTLERQLHAEEARERTQAVSAELAVERYRHQAELERVRREELAEVNARLFQTQSRLTHQAEHDSLTGLANRVQFEARLHASLARVRRGAGGLAVLFIDLDHFKSVNDTLGHDAGDQLLRAVATRLKGSVRASDLVARLGGDEFTVLLDAVPDETVAEQIAHKLIAALTQPFTVAGRELRISASVGLALAPRDGLDPASIQKHADTAMYRVKHGGRGAVLSYTPAMSEQARHRLDLEQGLHGALERGEFELHYQPQFGVQSRAVLGLEALVRWRRSGELVPPAEFIPVAEESGLIGPLGRWVLREACAAAVCWRERHAGLRMAVNVSPVQFAQADFAGHVAAVLRESGLPPEALELELTESTVMRDVHEALRQLSELRALGVRVAIDDFGAGHSSMGLLRHLRVTTLKIDRSFVQDLMDREARALVAAVVALAYGLGLNVIAEGAETEAQLSALRDLGCAEVQGFALSRPLTAGQVGALLNLNRRDHAGAPPVLSV